MAKNDGGPAFPQSSMAEWDNECPSGMTLRDYFAGQALAGLATQRESGQLGAEIAASLAYLHADMMLIERAKAEPKGEPS